MSSSDSSLNRAAVIAALLLALLLGAAGGAAAPPAAAAQETPPGNQHAAPVTEIEINGLRSIPRSELLSLLDLSVGRPLDRRRVRAGIKRAFLKGIFEDIAVESNDGAKVTVTVLERKIIGGITVKGNDHFSKRFVRRHMGLKGGERLTNLKLERGLSALKKEMARRGFAGATASYAVTLKKGRRADVTLTVREGAPSTIRTIVINGPEEVVRSYLSLAEGDIYDETKVERLEQKVAERYKKEGSIGSSIAHAFEQGVLTLKVEKGKKVSLAFQGTAGLSTKTLMKAVPFSELNEISDDLVDEAVARIISLYHQEGYPFVQVVPVKSTPDDESIRYEFFVHEGEQFKVGAVQFSGAAVPPERLREVVSLKAGGPYNPDLLESDVELLTEFYHALGRLYVTVGEPEVSFNGRQALVAFTLTEGPEVTVTGLEVKNNRVLTTEELLREIRIRPGAPYNEVDLADARRKLLELYNKRGFLDARVAIEREISATAAQVTFVIDEGEPTRFGKAVFIGNERTKPQVLARELLHKEGEILDYSVLLRERQRLYRTGLFNDIEITPAEKSGPERDILYRVQEANAGAVEFGLGYGEYEKFRAFLDVGYRNLFGTNRQVSFRTELSTLDQRFILSYFEPWFFDEDIALRALLLHEKREERNLDTGDTRFRLTRNTASVGLEKRLSGTVKAEFYYDFSVVKTSDVQPGVVLSKEDTGSLIVSGIRPGIIYDTRDNPFEPRRGVLAGLTLKLATSYLFSETDFFKIQAYVNTYRALNRWLVLAVSLRSGLAEGFRDTQELPLVERFFLGGRTTVRGYNQDLLGPKGSDDNPTGGNAFAMGNFELRADIGKGIGLVGFVDAGNVWTKAADFNPSDLKYTTGLGFRYSTPVGPLRVDYGIKLNKEKGENAGEIHFSLGHAF